MYNKFSLKCRQMNTHHAELLSCIANLHAYLENREILLYLHNLFIHVQSQLNSEAAIPT